MFRIVTSSPSLRLTVLSTRGAILRSVVVASMAPSIPPDTRHENWSGILGWVVEPCGTPQDVARERHAQVRKRPPTDHRSLDERAEKLRLEVDEGMRAAMTDAPPHPARYR